MVAQVVPERDFRGPGCSDACRTVRTFVPGRFGRSDLLLHDPSTHEEYGRVTAGPAGSVVVWTGPLVIDRWARTATVDGRPRALTRQEWLVLDHLAANLGRVCSHAEILHAAWGPTWIDAVPLLRITVNRLRARLDDDHRSADGLIQTVVGRGYVLQRTAPGEAGSRPQPSAGRRWALAWKRCVCCGKTERPHFAFGRCTSCRFRREWWKHYGPCGAPPTHEEE